MPEYLRALVAILVLAGAVFAVAKSPACAMACTAGDFERRRNLWFGITLAAFVAHNFWIFMVVAAALLLLAMPKEPNKLAMYLLLLFAVPVIPRDVSALGLINYLFTIDYVRLLALVVLFPAFVSLWSRPDTERFGRLLPDKLLAAYLILIFVLQLRVDTLTNALRHGIFYGFIDVFLPYYVASRSLKDLGGFRDALTGFVLAGLVLSAIGAFEFAKYWLLYPPLEDVLDARWDLGNYLGRGNVLRAQASTGQPIVLGYVIAVAAGLSLFLTKSVPSAKARGLGMLLLMAGLVAALSRGPWVGAAATFLVFIATGAFAGMRLAKLGLLGAILLPALLASPAGKTIVDYLPFVGTVEAENVTYRQQLLEISLEVVQQNPVFGAPHFMQLPVMQQLRQGQGIIDIVNTYLGVALESGLVGLALFAGFFIAVAAGLFMSMRSVPDRNDELYLLGRALFSTLLGILIMIFTLSSISVVPVVYWCVAGLGVAYARMLALARAPATARRASLQPATLT
jgi:O-antigen ligase/polysaccharide polymerase Wzy-like membrane protein